MTKRKSIKAKDVMLWVADKVVAASTSCDLNLTADTEDSGTKDDGFWGSPEITGMKWNANNESFDCVGETTTNDQAFDSLYDLFIAGEPVKVTMGVPTNKSDDGIPEGGWTAPTASSTSPMYEGQAIITSLVRKAQKGSKVNVTLALEGVGKLAQVKGV